MGTTADLLRRPRHGVDELESHLASWEDAGIITPDQHAAITALESHPPETAEERPRLSLGAEVAVYLGSILALMGGAVIIGRAWEGLVFAGRLAIALAVAALGFAAGATLARFPERPTQRLASFLWLIGTGGVVLAIVALFDVTGFDHGGWNLVAIGLPITAIGAGLWRNRDLPLQFLTTIVGIGFVAGGLGEILGLPLWVGGLAVWSAAAVAGTLALVDRLHPELFVLAGAAIGVMVGGGMFGADIDERLGLALQTANAAGVVAIGLARRLNPILVLGVLGFLFGVQNLLMTAFGGALGSMGVALVGIAIVVGVLMHTLRRDQVSADRAPPRG
jgi:hypothetical protein